MSIDKEIEKRNGNKGKAGAIQEEINVLEASRNDIIDSGVTNELTAYINRLVKQDEIPQILSDLFIAASKLNIEQLSEVFLQNFDNIFKYVDASKYKELRQVSEDFVLAHKLKLDDDIVKAESKVEEALHVYREASREVTTSSMVCMT